MEAKLDDETMAASPNVMGLDKDSSNEDERVQLEEVQSIPTDPPPDGGYGWVCVICVFFVNAHTWGLNSVCNSCWYIHSSVLVDECITVLRCLLSLLPSQRYLPRRLLP